MVRLDVLLAERGLVESRSRAQALVLAGRVRVDDRVVTKAGSNVGADARLDVDHGPPFVSRGGAKLAPRSTRSRSTRAGCARSTSARRRAASPTACCSEAPSRCARRRRTRSAARSRPGPARRVLDRVNIRADAARCCRSRRSRRRSTSRSSRCALVLPAVLAARDAGCAVPLVKPQFEVGRATGAGRGGARSRGAARRARARCVCGRGARSSYAGRVLVGPCRARRQPRVLPAHRQSRPSRCRQAAPRPRCPPRSSRR